MFGRSKEMHIADADDAEVEAFDAGRIDVLEAFCGELIQRGWFFTWGGARRNAPICEECAVAAGWVWDEASQDWYAA